MKTEDVVDLYDEGYAAAYDSRFLLLPWAQQSSEFELSVIKEELGDQGSYLDVGCGTGWFLSQFPGRDRAGLDISPAMIDKARSVNPDAELRQGNFLEDQPDWRDRWDLISCMWFAYCYVETVDDVGRLIANTARWATPTGGVLLPVCDTKALGLDPHHLTNFPYKSVVGHFGGLMKFTSITWTWDEPGSGKFHGHLVSPHIEHLIELFSEHFNEVQIRHYPRVYLDIGEQEPWVWDRSAILAKHKRAEGDRVRSRVVDVPAPGQRDQNPEGAPRTHTEESARAYGSWVTGPAGGQPPNEQPSVQAEAGATPPAEQPLSAPPPAEQRPSAPPSAPDPGATAQQPRAPSARKILLRGLRALERRLEG